jgi:hypothetical protein
MMGEPSRDDPIERVLRLKLVTVRVYGKGLPRFLALKNELSIVAVTFLLNFKWSISIWGDHWSLSDTLPSTLRMQC